MSQRKLSTSSEMALVRQVPKSINSVQHTTVCKTYVDIQIASFKKQLLKVLVLIPALASGNDKSHPREQK